MNLQVNIGESDLKVCPHCGNETPHKLLFNHVYQPRFYNSDGSLNQYPSPDYWYQVFECSTCHDISLYGFMDVDGDCGKSSLMFPKGDDLDESVPHCISSIYKEAKRVQEISPNAFSVLIRRSLEAICDDRGVSSGRLQRRLEELSNRGEIPPVLAEMTSILRLLGNSGAHNTSQSVTVPMTWSMDRFFRTLIEYIYVAPHYLSEFRKEIEKDKDL